MTIKQLGGIFGRNPTFEDVTIEGQLTFDGDIDINSDLTVGGDLNVNGVLDITQTNTRGAFLRSNTTGSRMHFLDGTTAGVSTVGIGAEANNLVAYAGGQEVLRGLSSNGDISVAVGNLVIGTSGKGIDFSATSGTGTSELFDDYEEGTWTPTYSFSGGGTVTTATNGGLYVKIGRMVYVSGALRSTAVSGISGSCIINGLPYACEDASGSAGSISIGYARSWGSDMPNLRGWIGGTATSISLYKNATNAGGSAVTSSEFDTGANNNVVEFIGVYRTSS